MTKRGNFNTIGGRGGRGARGEGGVDPLFSSITVARKCSECTETQNKYIFFSFIVGRGLDLAGQKLLNSLNWGGWGGAGGSTH